MPAARVRDLRGLSKTPVPATLASSFLSYLPVPRPLLFGRVPSFSSTPTAEGLGRVLGRCAIMITGLAATPANYVANRRRARTTNVFLPAHGFWKPSFVIGNEAGDVAKKLPVSLLRSLQPWLAPRQSAQARHSASWVLYSVNVLVAVNVNISSAKSIFGSVIANV